MRKLSTAVVVASLMACRGDTALTPSAVSGTWSLQAVDGKPLPYLMPAPLIGNRYQMVDDQMIIAVSGSVAGQRHLRMVDGTGNPLLTQVDMNGHQLATTGVSMYGGSFTLDGASVLFVIDNGPSRAGTMAGGRMTVTMPNATFLYQKQE